MLAVEAFRAAADPKFHPEQLTGGVTPVAGAPADLEPVVVEHQAGRRARRVHQAGRRRLRARSLGRVVRRDRRRQPQHAQEPGVRRRAAPARPASSTSSCSAEAVPGPAKRARRRRACSPASTSRLGPLRRKRAGEASTGRVARAVHAFDSDGAARRRSPRCCRSTRPSTRVPDAAWRAQKRRELRALIARLRGPLRRCDRGRLPGRARRRRRGHRDRHQPLAGAP